MKQFFIIALILLLSLSLGCSQVEDKNKNENCLDDTCLIQENSNNKQNIGLPDASDMNSQDINVSVSLQIFTDKKEYSSHEQVIITVNAFSSEELSNATIKVWGITPSKYNYIENEKKVDLKPGENVIGFNESTPNCTKGCGGVYPGPYKINASIEVNGKELTKTNTTITLIES